MRGFGCLFVLVVLLAVAAGGAGVWALATAFGFIDASHAGRVVATGGVVLGLVLLFGVVRLARAFARPVDDLVEAASRVEEGDYSARVTVKGPRDLRSLARAFNAMSARLEETDRQRRAYLADVTHELRTPLSVIQGQLEGVIDGIYAPDPERLRALLEQVQTLDGLIGDLRTLTLVETGGLALRREPVDVGVLVNGAVDALRATAATGRVDLRVDVGTGLPTLEADPVRLRSVLSNLLVNALRHTPPGGTVTAEVSADPAAVHVLVRDTGPGFPPDLLPHVFERFVRTPESSGSGLGLAIARDLVMAHGGTITARNEAGGAVVAFSLPLAAEHRAP